MSLPLRKITILLFFLFALRQGMAAAAPVFTDWGWSRMDWKTAMYFTAELGTRQAPPPTPRNAQESKGYAAYLKALYLISQEEIDEEAAAPEQVASLLAEAIDLFPEENSPFFTLSKYRSQRNEDALFLEDVRPVATRHPDSLRLQQNFAAALLDLVRLDEAEELLRHVSELAPDHPTTLLLLGNLCFLRNDSQRGLEVVQKYATIPPASYTPYHALLEIKFYQQQRKLAPAARAAERLIRLPEAYATLHVLQQVLPVLIRLQAWNFLRDYATRFERLNGNQLSQKPLTQLCSAVSLANLRLHDYDSLAYFLETLLGRSYCNAELLEAFCKPITDAIDGNKITTVSEERRLSEIVARAYEAMIHYNPRNNDYRKQLALAYYGQGAVQKALAILSTLKNLTPQDSLLKAHLLARAKRLDEALEIYASFEKNARYRRYRNAYYYLIYGCNAEENGETERALQILRQGMAQYPNDAPLANSLGYILADHQQSMEEAKALVAKALRKEPANPAYLDSQAWVHFRLGEYAPALLVMSKALKTADLPLLHLDHEMGTHLQEILDVLGYPDLAKSLAIFEETP